MNHEIVTDEQIEEALIKFSGRPGKVAESLNLNYTTIFRRIRKNPKLLEVQRSTRSKTFVELTHLTEFAIKTGYMHQQVLDENGKPTDKTSLVPIAAQTRMDGAFRLMALFKGDEEIVDKVEVTGKGSVPISVWLEVNTENKNDKGTGDI